MANVVIKVEDLNKAVDILMGSGVNIMPPDEAQVKEQTTGKVFGRDGAASSYERHPSLSTCLKSIDEQSEIATLLHSPAMTPLTSF